MNIARLWKWLVTFASGITAIATAAQDLRRIALAGFFVSMSKTTMLLLISSVIFFLMVVSWCVEILGKRFKAEAEKRAADDKTAMLRIGFIEERLAKLEKSP